MSEFKEFANNYLKDLENNGLKRKVETINGYENNNRNGNNRIIKDNKEYIAFNDNDYFNLSCHKDVIKAAIDSTKTYGMGIRSSRLISGNNDFYDRLETLLAQIKGTETSLVLGSGFLTNMAVITALAEKSDLIIADKLVHASIIDAIKLSGAKFFRFKHNDIKSCQELLIKHRKNYRHCFIISETIFSMDGDIAPIDELFLLSEKYKALLITDDAHGFGLKNNFTHKAHIQIGTLSKAIGAYGGYVACDKIIRDFLINKARGLIYSTSLPIPILAAAISALEIIQKNPHLAKIPLDNAKYFCKLLKITPPQSPIVPLILGDNKSVIGAQKILSNNGFLISAIRYPTVPKNTARLRFTFNASHKDYEIEQLCNVILKNILV